MVLPQKRRMLLCASLSAQEQPSSLFGEGASVIQGEIIGRKCLFVMVWSGSVEKLGGIK